MLKRFLLLLLATATIWPIITTRAASQLSSAVSYLQSHYKEQGAGGRDWAAIGLGENGVSVAPSSPDSGSLLSQERNVLAQAAQGAGRTSEVTAIEETYQNDQFGDPNLINDDIFGVLAVASSDQSWLNSHQGVFTTIAASQRADGSLGFNKSGEGDGDITAATIWALALASDRPTTVLTNATTFLHNCQNADGGFGFQPGAVSSVATSSWAMIAQNTLGQDSSAVRNYLFSQEKPGGYWLQGSSANYLNSAYAVMALSGDRLPFIKRAASSPPANSDNNPPNGSSPLTRQPSAAPKNSTPKTLAIPTATPTTSLPKALPKKPARRIIHRTVIQTTTTEILVTCSASASASAGDGYATSSASAGCQ